MTYEYRKIIEKKIPKHQPRVRIRYALLQKVYIEEMRKSCLGTMRTLALIGIFLLFLVLFNVLLSLSFSSISELMNIGELFLFEGFIILCIGVAVFLGGLTRYFEIPRKWHYTGRIKLDEDKKWLKDETDKERVFIGIVLMITGGVMFVLSISLLV